MGRDGQWWINMENRYGMSECVALDMKSKEGKRNAGSECWGVTMWHFIVGEGD